MHQLAEGQDPSDFDRFEVAAGDSLTRMALWGDIRPILERYARVFGWGLAPDLREDIVQQAWLSLMSRGNEPWLNGRIPQNIYIRGVVRDAAETIRAQYRAAGEESRIRNRRMKGAWPRDIAMESLRAFEEAAGPGSLERTIFARLELEYLFDNATSEVREALRLIWEDGATLEEAAAAAGITRRTLCRRLEHLRFAA